jgi:hypothetical protein
MEKHLGIWWLWKEDDDGIYLERSMDKMKQDIILQYKGYVGAEIREASTPAFPSLTLKKSDPNDPAIAETEYRSLVGSKLQYYQTKMGPTICNAT